MVVREKVTGRDMTNEQVNALVLLMAGFVPPELTYEQADFILSNRNRLAKEVSEAFSRVLSHTNLKHLSAREEEILGLIRQGATNKEIAARLLISVNTVKNHIQHIMAKLHVRNRTQAVWSSA